MFKNCTNLDFKTSFLTNDLSFLQEIFKYQNASQKIYSRIIRGHPTVSTQMCAPQRHVCVRHFI